MPCESSKFLIKYKGEEAKKKTITVKRHNLRPIPKDEVIAREQRIKARK
jgi:hypothetical protein